MQKLPTINDGLSEEVAYHNTCIFNLNYIDRNVI